MRDHEHLWNRLWETEAGKKGATVKMKALIEIQNSQAHCGVIPTLIAEVNPEEKFNNS